MTTDPQLSPANVQFRAAQRVFSLLKQRAELNHEIDETIKKAWPIDSEVSWVKTGHYPVYGVVIDHVYGGLKVQNVQSMKIVRIEPSHIERARHV